MRLRARHDNCGLRGDDVTKRAAWGKDDSYTGDPCNEQASDKDKRRGQTCEQ